MSDLFLVSLSVVVIAVLAARLVLSWLPLRHLSRAIPLTDAVLAGVGSLGLAFHCGAMFFRQVFDPLPGADAIVGDIRALGTASLIWYAAPAGLLLLGLRRLHAVAATVMAVALAGVGITMYNGGSLQAHLVAIFVSVTLLAAITTTLVLPPRRQAPVAP